MKIKPIKVSVLNQYIKKYLMSNSILNNLRVEGEISNIRLSKTGYTYFSLCDGASCINCVAFFADNISKNGDRIIADGEISLYEVKGVYQLTVRNIERIGLGKILSDLESLKEKLKSQGMFDRHMELPEYPSKIGIVTSKSGAAIKDILKTFESVRADFEVIIYNTLVQGEKSIDSIISGVNFFNENNADVILISRGGGSFEDLNVFNDLKVAEEVYKSSIPVVTGIGHETDRTLTDYVADIYCHTPTAAAERIIRGYKDVEEKLERYVYALKHMTHNIITIKQAEIKSSKYILKSYLPIDDIYRLKSQVENCKNAITSHVTAEINGRSNCLEILNEKLNSYNYKKLLEKGFALVTDNRGKIIKKPSQVEENDLINITYKDFKITAEAIKIEEVE
ncbi:MULTISPECIES: exodeoxyribonuclease VII large subunit [unclassified Sedimentibacter]|uniref:exodeoxyribonuclease VII large subunit n=1 Tax=unclassified Sedimentibacter TaxID=2649220 RepID=UPI0027DEF56D|nr:exodeoxyribonuclease VII large subunit [Sedimentibacter sp. MB35-C1]WMJ76236.1 exodeoxyribonuclease VII large subunit [Sedimentibacter sp. MB35-C1]